MPVFLRLVLLALLLPAAALAQPPVTAPIQTPDSSQEEEVEGPPFVTIRLAAFGTANSYLMGDLNGNIDALTPVVRQIWGVPEIELKRINNGVGYGFGLQAFFRNKIYFAAEYERVLGKSDVGGRLGRSEIDVPATAYLATIGYAVYAKSVRFGFAAGGGYYEADGTAGFTVFEEIVERYRLGGNTIGQHYATFVDSPLPGNFRMLVMVGYRSAKIDEPTVTMDIFIPDDEHPSDDPPPRFVVDGKGLDWSGFLGRASLGYTFF